MESSFAVHAPGLHCPWGCARTGAAVVGGGNLEGQPQRGKTSIIHSFTLQRNIRQLKKELLVPHDLAAFKLWIKARKQEAKQRDAEMDADFY